MSTYTFSGTDSYSVSDVKAVMQNTYEDIVGFANRQIMEYGKAERWIEDLTYLLNKNALKSFELQLYNSAGQRFKSYRYDVSLYGLITPGDKSGGINYFEIPISTTIALFADLDEATSNYSTVLKELAENRNWGTNGTAMEGNATKEKNYISNNLQLNRSVITK